MWSFGRYLGGEEFRQAGREQQTQKALKEIEIYKFPWVFKSLVDPGTVISVSCTSSPGPPVQLKMGFRESQCIWVAMGREEPGETRKGSVALVLGGLRGGEKCSN